MSLFGWLRPARSHHVDHVEIREAARLARVEADAKLLLASYFHKGFMSRRRVHGLGQRRWGQAYKLLKAAGLIDPITGHVRTRSHDRAVAVLHAEAAAFQRRIVDGRGRFTLPF